jgi:hypothetical protein
VSETGVREVLRPEQTARQAAGVYDHFRPGLEDQMYYCVKDLVEEYKKAQMKY